MFLTWAYLGSMVFDPLPDVTTPKQSVFLHPLGWDKRVWECDRVAYGWHWKSPMKAEVILYTYRLPYVVSWTGGFLYDERYYQRRIIQEVYYNILLARGRYRDLKKFILRIEEDYYEHIGYK